MTSKKQTIDDDFNWDEIDALEEQAGSALAAPKEEVREREKNKAKIKKDGKDTGLVKRRV